MERFIEFELAEPIDIRSVFINESSIDLFYEEKRISKEGYNYWVRTKSGERYKIKESPSVVLKLIYQLKNYNTHFMSVKLFNEYEKKKKEREELNKMKTEFKKERF